MGGGVGKLGVPQRPSMTDLKDWTAILLWGDLADFGPRSSATNFCESGWWPNRSIKAFFPVTGIEKFLKADGEGCWDVLVVTGMSQITVGERCKMISEVAADVKEILTAWAPHEMRASRLRKAASRADIQWLIAQIEDWAAESIGLATRAEWKDLKQQDATASLADTTNKAPLSSFPWAGGRKDEEAEEGVREGRGTDDEE
eukprot:3063584-Pyramimonas_sp.AAC.1